MFREERMKLAVNIDHFATLREARRAKEPEPVLVALLAEQAGAQGIVCHLRGDRRHIKERDLQLLRQTIQTKLNLEMAATAEMIKAALEVKPDVVSLVPERPDELTTQGGLNVLVRRKTLAPLVQKLHKAGIKVSIFIDAHKPQILAAAEIGVRLIEINTGPYSEVKPGRPRDKVLEDILQAAEFGLKSGLEEVHAGHGLDYHNVQPIVGISCISELSIGFSIVARSAVVGVSQAVTEMTRLLEKQP
jgi:pyridoxine 5-phosphate synthase